MGIPLVMPSATTGKPPAGDQANAVITGTFTAAGQVSQPFAYYGATNVSIWGIQTVTLATQADSATATVNPGGLVAAGEGIYSPLGIVPAGTTIASTATVNMGGLTTITLGGLTTQQVSTLTALSDATAQITGFGLYPSLTVVLERTFDGGNTWIPAGIGGAGQPAEYIFGSSNLTSPVSFVMAEPEKAVFYRLHCTAYSSGTAGYRISATGLAATTWGVQVG